MRLVEVVGYMSPSFYSRKTIYRELNKNYLFFKY